jgi:FkbM family methyltransferase
VYAFEPVPSNAALVRRNAARNGMTQIQVVEIAVGNRNETARLVLAEYSGGAALAGIERPPDETGEIDVEVVTVDHLVERGYRPPNLVKIDVEGAELLVLQGMEQVCARHRPDILYELDGPNEESLDLKRAKCERWLRERGYGVVELPRSYEGRRWCVRHFLATADRPHAC